MKVLLFLPGDPVQAPKGHAVHRVSTKPADDTGHTWFTWCGLKADGSAGWTAAPSNAGRCNNCQRARNHRSERTHRKLRHD